MRHSGMLRHRRHVVAAIAVVTLIAGCGGTASAPAGDSAAPASGLSGEMIGTRGVVLGNVGGGGQTVNLFMSNGANCDTSAAAQQTTTSQPDGSYSFQNQVDQSGSYCIEYGGQTHVCNCVWSGDTCTCSPPAVP